MPENEIRGLREKGNIDLTNRPTVKNEDGSISTVRSLGVNIDGQEVLIPTVSDDGKVLSDEEAIKLYEETGQHLGIFDSPEASTEYAKTLSGEQAEMYVEESSIAPWKKEWGKVSTPSPPEENTFREDLSDNIPPWQKEWGRMPSYFTEKTVRQSSGGALRGPIDFDNVFERLIQAESRGRHRDSTGRLTTSPVGAKGITQVMPKTGKDPGYGVTPLRDNTEEEFIRFGRDYLQAMVNEFDGDMEKAVAAYNAGPASVKRAVARASDKGGSWVNYLPKKSETIPYMKKILGDISG